MELVNRLKAAWNVLVGKVEDKVDITKVDYTRYIAKAVDGNGNTIVVSDFIEGRYGIKDRVCASSLSVVPGSGIKMMSGRLEYLDSVRDLTFALEPAANFSDWYMNSIGKAKVPHHEKAVSIGSYKAVTSVTVDYYYTISVLKEEGVEPYDTKKGEVVYFSTENKELVSKVMRTARVYKWDSICGWWVSYE